MPRIKRWFPVSQCINTDPEVRALKRDCGLPGFSMWLEVLARTDQTGVLKGSEKDICSILGGVCNSNTRGSARALKWFTDMGWIKWQRGSEPGNRWGLIVVNHADYHVSREHKKNDEGNLNAPPPSEPSEPSEMKEPDRAASRVGSQGKKSKAGLSQELKAVADRVYDSNRKRFSKLIQWIKRKQSEGFEDIDIQAALENLETREKKIGPVDDWWAYLDGKNEADQVKIIEKLRTKRLQGESERHKHGDLTHVGSILKKIGS